jgi:hypothetical protein
MDVNTRRLLGRVESPSNTGIFSASTPGRGLIFAVENFRFWDSSFSSINVIEKNFPRSTGSCMFKAGPRIVLERKRSVDISFIIATKRDKNDRKSCVFRIDSSVSWPPKSSEDDRLFATSNASMISVRRKLVTFRTTFELSSVFYLKLSLPGALNSDQAELQKWGVLRVPFDINESPFVFCLIRRGDVSIYLSLI